MPLWLDRPDECAPGEELSEEEFLAKIQEIECAVTSSAMGNKSWLLLRGELGACRVERGHANYARWKVAAKAVIRRRVECDTEDESGEEEESEQGSYEPGQKTSGLGLEDCVEMDDDGAST